MPNNPRQQDQDKEQAQRQAEQATNTNKQSGGGSQQSGTGTGSRTGTHDKQVETDKPGQKIDDKQPGNRQAGVGQTSNQPKR